MANEDYADISCIEEWLERKGWSTDLAEEEQRRLEGQFVAEYSDVRTAMWKRHYESLDPAEKALIDEETHPSTYPSKTLYIFIKVCYSPSYISHPTLASSRAIAVSARQIRKS